jgi:hypothetical protein
VTVTATVFPEVSEKNWYGLMSCLKPALLIYKPIGSVCNREGMEFTSAAALVKWTQLCLGLSTVRCGAKHVAAAEKQGLQLVAPCVD